MIWKIKLVTEGRNEGEKATLRFAGRELKRYLAMATEESILLIEEAGWEEDGLILGIGGEGLPAVENPAEDDAILIEVTGHNGRLTGTNARSVLMAVYRFLREKGYCFLRPGKTGERAPERLSEGDVFLREAADHRERTVCIEGANFYETVEDMIDWLPKVGMNGYYIQFYEPTVFFERWYGHGGTPDTTNPYLSAEEVSLEDARGMKKSLEQEIALRGLRYEAMGHGWTCKPLGLPASGWDVIEDEDIPKEISQYFAQIDGERKQFRKVLLNTHLCYGNPEVQKRMVDYAVQYCRENPQVDAISYCLADSQNNHCECEWCRDTRPADFYVKIMNEIDRRLTEEGIPTKILFCVYTDLLFPPEKEKFNDSDRFVLMFCPIQRQYGEPLDVNSDYELPEYVRNRMTYPGDIRSLSGFLREWRKVYHGKSIVFDYYYMWIHYWEMGYTDMARILHEDIRNYKKMGFEGLISCQGQRVFTPTSLGMNIMARTLWNRETEFEVERDDILRAEFGEEFALVRDLLEGLSKYSAPQVVRKEVAISDPALPALYEEGLGRLEAFAPVLQRNLGRGDALQQVSWQNLGFYLELAKRMLEGYLSCAKGCKENPWPDIKDFVDRQEWAMRQDFDAYEFKYSFSWVFPYLLKTGTAGLKTD